jgi:chemotaxis methyl-accepting protein methylase
MRIQQIANYNYSPMVNFTSMPYQEICYVDTKGRSRITQPTTAIRNDVDWLRLAEIIKNNFKDKPRINIMPMNCSDGTECYELASKIIRVFGMEDAKKRVFPIISTDIYEFVIENFGQKGLVAFYKSDVEKFGKENIEKYFTETDMSRISVDPRFFHEGSKALEAKPEFQELFSFEVMDLQKRIKNIHDDGNSVVLIRNCLAQSFGSSGTFSIILELDQKLKKGSLLVLGGYDTTKLTQLDTMILDCSHFEKLEENIYIKN